MKKNRDNKEYAADAKKDEQVNKQLPETEREEITRPEDRRVYEEDAGDGE